LAEFALEAKIIVKQEAVRGSRPMAADCCRRGFHFDKRGHSSLSTTVEKWFPWSDGAQL